MKYALIKSIQNTESLTKSIQNTESLTKSIQNTELDWQYTISNTNYSISLFLSLQDPQQ